MSIDYIVLIISCILMVIIAAVGLYLLTLNIAERKNDIKINAEYQKIKLKEKELEILNKGLIDSNNFKLSETLDAKSGRTIRRYVYLNKYVFTEDVFRTFIDRELEHYLIRLNGDDKEYSNRKTPNINNHLCLMQSHLEPFENTKVKEKTNEDIFKSKED